MNLWLHRLKHMGFSILSCKGRRGVSIRTIVLSLIFTIIVYIVIFADTLSRGNLHITDYGSLSRGFSHVKVASPCNKAYYPERHVIQYILMIDAGSTGSRIHIYRFNNCGPTPELENEIFAQTEKRSGGSGLSSYGDDAESAARSLDSLLHVAMKSVPDSMKSCSPLVIKATAGLRLLGEELSANIIKAIRNRVENEYPFPLLLNEGQDVQVMQGRDEGIYAWITLNYLLNRIGTPPDQNNVPFTAKRTAAIFDMGGGSSQVVFEVRSKKHGKHGDTMKKGEHEYKLKFGEQNFRLYQHSYLGYGLMSIREKVHKSVFDNMTGRSQRKREPEPGKFTHSFEVENPCIISGLSRQIKLPAKLNNDEIMVNVTMKGPRSGQPEQCRGLIRDILNVKAQCNLKPCSFDGVYQPNLREILDNESEVYLFSYMYDRIHEIGMPETFTLSQLDGYTDSVCRGEVAWKKTFRDASIIQALRDRPEFCLDLTYISTLLTVGHGLPLNQSVKIVKKVKGFEVGWPLGASLPHLDHREGTWKCKLIETS